MAKLSCGESGYFNSNWKLKEKNNFTYLHISCHEWKELPFAVQCSGINTDFGVHISRFKSQFCHFLAEIFLISLSFNFLIFQKRVTKYPSDLVVRTLGFHCQGYGFNPRLGN